MDSGDKSANKAMSAAYKYALMQVFCIPTDEPKDTENETHEVAPKTVTLTDRKLDPSGPQKTCATCGIVYNPNPKAAWAMDCLKCYNTKKVAKSAALPVIDIDEPPLSDIPF